MSTTVWGGGFVFPFLHMKGCICPSTLPFNLAKFRIARRRQRLFLEESLVILDFLRGVK